MLFLLKLGAQLVGADGRNPLVLAEADVLLAVAERGRSVSPGARDVVDALATSYPLLLLQLLMLVETVSLREGELLLRSRCVQGVVRDIQLSHAVL